MASENSDQNLGDDGTVTLRPVSALVPEQVSRGVFSTGVIAITGNTEFILDFVLAVGTPNTVVSRVICTHEALSRIVAAIRRNVEAFTGREGGAASGEQLGLAEHASPASETKTRGESQQVPDSLGMEQFVGASIPVPDDQSGLASSAGGLSRDSASDAKLNPRKQNPLDLYDDIIVPDEVHVKSPACNLLH